MTGQRSLGHTRPGATRVYVIEGSTCLGTTGAMRVRAPRVYAREPRTTSALIDQSMTLRAQARAPRLCTVGGLVPPCEGFHKLLEQLEDQLDQPEEELEREQDQGQHALSLEGHESVPMALAHDSHRFADTVFSGSLGPASDPQSVRRH